MEGRASSAEGQDDRCSWYCADRPRFDDPPLVDVHLHLQDYASGTDVPRIIGEAITAGVDRLVCNGTEEADWAQVEELARAHPRVIPFFGVHPWYIDRCADGWLARLEGFLTRVRSGVGEIGLDRHLDHYDRDQQEVFFCEQLRLARQLDRPVAIHCLQAWGWLMTVLRREPGLPRRLLFHAYNGAGELIGPLAEMGAFFSFSGSVLHSNHLRARKSLLQVPLDRLLIETDAPAMLPPSAYRGLTVKTAEGHECSHPGNLPVILAGIAELLGQPAAALQERLWENARAYLGELLEPAHEPGRSR
ncbi:MAG: TatD family hydrolase [Candidatus Latescibacterota bacterium]|jgi:TatD DNase family protein